MTSAGPNRPAQVPNRAGGRPAPRIAVTLGDPRGIGPEVVAAASGRFLDESPGARLVFFGPDGSDPGLGAFVDAGRWDGTERGAGRVTAESIRMAAESALSGRVDALVTGPVHKPALRAAGWDVPGQTEMLQRLTGAGTVGMLMCSERTRLGGALRVLLATTHVALSEVPRLLTTELLVAQTRLLDATLRRDWGIGEPRIALCAVNPHASDRGLFGDEEARVYGPAVDALRADGIGVVGPVSADTVFSKALSGSYDAVVAPYHDVGMAAFKTVAFGTGVNVTIGLPFPRTSPDHGTAFDLVGKGVADSSSTLEALRLAGQIQANRQTLQLQTSPSEAAAASRPTPPDGHIES